LAATGTVVLLPVRFIRVKVDRNVHLGPQTTKAKSPLAFA
jgi:hypothetical protein